MVRCGYYHRIDVFVLFVQHPAEIAVLFSVRVALKSCSRILLVHIAQSDNVFTAEGVEVAGPSAAYAYTGYIQLLARRNMTGTPQNGTGHNRERRRCRRTTHKITPG